MAELPTIEDIAKMSVKDATAALPALTDDQLAQLKKLETKDGDDEGRVTMVAAIDAEQSRRVANAAPANDPNGNPSSATAPTAPVAASDPATPAPDQSAPNQSADYFESLLTAAQGLLGHREDQLIAIGEAIGAEAYDDIATGVVVLDRVSDLAIARLALLHDAQEQLTSLRAKVAELEQHKLLGEAPIGSPVADHTHVTQRATGSFMLVLMDGDREVTELPPIMTEPNDFRQRSADTAVYERSIAIPVLTAPFRLTAVALFDPDGDLVDTCAMVPVMEAGGGRSVELPGGTLVFRQPERSAAEAARVADAINA